MRDNINSIFGDELCIMYFYIYQQVKAYKCCGCCFPLTKWAHLGDIKAVCIFISKTDETIKNMYYCAHGHFQGQWVPLEKITFHLLTKRERHHREMFLVPHFGLQPKLVSLPIVKKILGQVQSNQFILISMGSIII